MQSCQSQNSRSSSDDEDVPPLGNTLILSGCSDIKLHTVSISRTGKEYDAVHCIPSNQSMTSPTSEPSQDTVQPQNSDQNPENACLEQPESSSTGRDLRLLHGCRNTTLQNVTIHIADTSRNPLEVPAHLMEDPDVLKMILEHSRNK
ncbi:hypothetical protein K435DRAFT_871636 [Dendrothele bispora CBS 962.96]|uniref:Uncharacterized protein n=1 Tax=Dendrothele bispora (strain CBS 962.96) TaxID=1314807 RepID=A0A4S8L482_DENBC|nr:hypothetical protein K435DRAFT_871636 [Dendrothele bispora CBS 962.96]